MRRDCRPALETVLAHLSSRGLLDDDAEAIAVAHGLRPDVVAECIRAIKVVGPPGIAERDATAVLTAQAGQLVDNGDAPAWFAQLVRNHLELVAEQDAPAITDVFGVDIDAAQRAIELVATRLRPYVAIDSAQDPQRAAPDVIVCRGGIGRLRVEVPDSRWFGIRIARVPAAYRDDPTAMTWLRPHRTAAHNLLKQIDIRANVLTAVAEAAVTHQRSFFESGLCSHRPLTRTTLAHELGLHHSTVVRAVAGKVLRRPDGQLMPLADLFGKSVAVRAHLQRMLTSASVNDAQLCADLANLGYSVSRRTVAKYRADLGIPPAGARRN